MGDITTGFEDCGGGIAAGIGAVIVKLTCLVREQLIQRDLSFKRHGIALQRNQCCSLRCVNFHNSIRAYRAGFHFTTFPRLIFHLLFVDGIANLEVK